MARMASFYESLEKAELHLHLEGSVEPETLLELDPTLSMEEVSDIYRYSDFAGFLRSYVWVSKKLSSPSHYALITRRLLERLHEQNVRYAEITLSVGVILWKEQDIEGIYRAIRQETWQSPVEVHWVFDATRQFGPEAAQKVAEIAVANVGNGVIAFGIGGDEVRGPAEWFTEVFAFTRDHGLGSVPHAGETTGPEGVWAVLQLNPDRIGHGIAAAQDPALMQHLRERNIPLEVCISSNVCTGAVASLEAHPVRRLFDAGVPIILNSDDPAMFHTTLSCEYEIAANHFGFSEAELRMLAANSFRYALGPRAEARDNR
jgi:aminodeoxyfutalosine deaminase